MDTAPVDKTPTDKTAAQTYRASNWVLVTLAISGLVLLLGAIGLFAIYFTYPTQVHTTVPLPTPAKINRPLSPLLTGIVVLLCACYLLLRAVGSRLTVTKDGLSLWRFGRLVEIPWNSVERFDWGMKARLGPMTQLDVHLAGARKIPLYGTAGTRARAGAVLAELTAALQRHRPAAQPRPR